ncbi:hypothetical protein LLE49_26595 [Alicyclobacillus tolerans]|uniref:CBO0543 family protein n=1 Tax=Alicyclobacillus tolerans TaxID=90970 RepID=UPI001F2614FA|nr:CBO0543 family protein [Alicyclobacillus tolerans]MCF8568296.1 hypothetical protein [Alicyclobacillus tolerans]
MSIIWMGIASTVSAWFWGDWRHWRQYLPTIQYFVLCDALYDLLTFGWRLWYYPHPPNVFPNHIITNLFVMLTIYPSSTLVYLYHYPYKQGVVRQTLYITVWIGAWAVWEFYMHMRSLLLYAHGWSYAWSIGFICVMIPMIRLHFTKPLTAYAVSVPIIVFLLIRFNVPVLNTN